jgi:hypothetical protein
LSLHGLLHPPGLQGSPPATLQGRACTMCVAARPRYRSRRPDRSEVVWRDPLSAVSRKSCRVRPLDGASPGRAPGKRSAPIRPCGVAFDSADDGAKRAASTRSMHDSSNSTGDSLRSPKSLRASVAVSSQGLVAVDLLSLHSDPLPITSLGTFADGSQIVRVGRRAVLGTCASPDGRGGRSHDHLLVADDSFEATGFIQCGCSTNRSTDISRKVRTVAARWRRCG